MTASIEVRTIGSDARAELYLTASSTVTSGADEAAAELFQAVRETLESNHARIFQERIYCRPAYTRALVEQRRRLYGDLDDGVGPTILCPEPLDEPDVLGLQLHAIVGPVELEAVELDGKPCGRLLRADGCVLLAVSALSDPALPDPADQARSCFEKALAVLRKYDADFRCVVRTWFWLGDILSWYDRFNQVRNRFFTEQGLIGPGRWSAMPASTGIGLRCADGSYCAMDLLAVLHPAGAIECFDAVGNQRCALEYGSAFSRAAKASTACGTALYISGTASIDAAGRTLYKDDAVAQIAATVENVNAVLRDTGFSASELVHLVAYCKDRQVAAALQEIRKDLPAPWIVVGADVCRADLLFELEGTAVRPG